MKEMNPPGQSSIEALHTITLYIYIEKVDRHPSLLSIDALHSSTPNQCHSKI